MSELSPRNLLGPPRAEELRPLEGKELASWKLALGDIYYQTPASGKLLLLKRVGERLEESWIERMRTNSGLRVRESANTKRVTDILAQWEHWESLEDSADRERTGARFCDFIRAGLHTEGGITLLDWSFACYNYLRPDEATELELLNGHEILHRRGLHVAGLAVIFAMGCGYSDPLFLRELYQTAWLLDIGLLKTDFSYWTAMACQAEKAQPGAGVALLKKAGASELEVKVFLEHPNESHRIALERFEKKFHNVGLLDAIARHHELADGKGFPRGIPPAALSDWESILVLADQMVDYRDEVLKQYATDGLRLVWQPFRQLPLRNLPIQRVLRKVARWSTQDNLGEVSA